MIFFKLLTGGIALVIFCLVIVLALRGRSVRKSKTLSGGYDQHLLSGHRAMVACVGCLTVLAIFLIEGQVRTSSNPYAVNGLLFGFHLLIDVMLAVIAVAIVMRFTGLRNPVVHRRLAYAAIVLFVISAGTGTWMLIELPS